MRGQTLSVAGVPVAFASGQAVDQLYALVTSLWLVPGFGQCTSAVMLRIGIVMIRSDPRPGQVLGSVLAEPGHRVLIALMIVGANLNISAGGPPRFSSWLMIIVVRPPTSLFAFSIASFR